MLSALTRAAPAVIFVAGRRVSSTAPSVHIAGATPGPRPDPPAAFPPRPVAFPARAPFLPAPRAARRMTTMASSKGPYEGVGFKAAGEEIDPRARVVLAYWFGEEGLDGDDPYYIPGDKKKIWFMGGKEIDDDIIAKFGGDLDKCAAGEYDGWRATAYGSLALTILTDQFSRNAYRNTAKMYSLDPMSLETVTKIHADPGLLGKLRPIERWWLVLPYMHDETMESQDKSLTHAKWEAEESKKAGEASDAASGVAAFFSGSVRHAEDHREVVAKWGRFPHRNAVVGRESTPEEVEFLKEHKGW